MRHVATGTLQPEDDLRPIPERNHEFLFKSFPYLLIFNGNPFTKNLGRCRDVKRGDERWKVG
jgi:hypothetical protein